MDNIDEVIRVINKFKDVPNIKHAIEEKEKEMDEIYKLMGRKQI